jgi:hypothetical protein
MAQMNRTDVAEVSHKIQNYLLADYQYFTLKKVCFCKDWGKKQTF